MKHSRHSSMLFTQPLNHIVYRVPPILNTASVHQAPVVVVFFIVETRSVEVFYHLLCSAYSSLDLWNYKCLFCTDRLSVWPAQGKCNFSRSSFTDFFHCLSQKAQHHPPLHKCTSNPLTNVCV